MRALTATTGLLAGLLWCTSALAAPTPPTSASSPPTSAPDQPVTTGAEDPIPETGDTIDFGPVSTVPYQVPPPLSGNQVVSEPLVVVPVGCASPTPAQAVFVGTIAAQFTDSTNGVNTARFHVDQLRAGSLNGFTVGAQVDVQYPGEPPNFLHIGRQYFVGVAAQPATGRLVSRVRPPAPLFGGDAVIGVNDSDLSCPVLEDPVRTLTVAGTSVDSGVFTPLRAERGALLAAVLKPLAIAFAVLIMLVLLKHLFFGMGRSLRALTDNEEPMRRRHRRALAHGATADSGVADQAGP